jgi:hypothetical protein
MEVEEPRARDLEARQMGRRVGLDHRGKCVRDRARWLPNGLRELQGDVCGPIAVLALIGCFERDAAGRLEVREIVAEPN